jgi:hypothetical protein
MSRARQTVNPEPEQKNTKIFSRLLDRLITDQFRDLAAAGPAMYASFLGTDGGERERRHAHGSAKAFASALHHRGIQVGS